MAHFGRNSCITSSKIVKTNQNWRQNDGQSTPDNVPPLWAPYIGYTEKTVISRYFGQKWIITPQMLQKSFQAYSGRHFDTNFELFRPFLTKLCTKNVQNRPFWPRTTVCTQNIENRDFLKIYHRLVLKPPKT